MEEKNWKKNVFSHVACTTCSLPMSHFPPKYGANFDSFDVCAFLCFLPSEAAYSTGGASANRDAGSGDWHFTNRLGKIPPRHRQDCKTSKDISTREVLKYPVSTWMGFWYASRDSLCIIALCCCRGWSWLWLCCFYFILVVDQYLIGHLWEGLTFCEKKKGGRQAGRPLLCWYELRGISEDPLRCMGAWVCRFHTSYYLTWSASSCSRTVSFLSLMLFVHD